MGQPAAKQGDAIKATDNHLVLVPGTPAVSMLLPHPFNAVVSGGLSANVNIMGKPAALVDSTADNMPSHVPTSPGYQFLTKPSNKATIRTGSATVNINGRPAARNGDKAQTCNDPVDALVGTVMATGTVFIG